MRADSIGVVKMLVEGGKNGVTLDAPKGMAIVGDTLWVADIDHVRAFNKRTGARSPTSTFGAEGHVPERRRRRWPDGAVYVTDTGILFDDKGAMSHPGTDQIFKIVGRKATAPSRPTRSSARTASRGTRANGRFVLAPFGGKVVSDVEGPATSAGRRSRRVPAVRRRRSAERRPRARHELGGQRGARDLERHDVEGRRRRGWAGGHRRRHEARTSLAVPRFNDGKVEYYKIP